MTGQRGQVALPTEWGRFTAAFTARGLSRLWFPGALPDHSLPARASLPAPEQLAHWAAQTRRALAAALRGEPLRDPPPLDWPPRGTAFQIAVWEALREIPTGRTVTYGALAARLGRPGAARAVGGACGANPIPVLVPCHRVLAANGTLGGFSAGLAWKRRLLAVEGNGKWLGKNE